MLILLCLSYYNNNHLFKWFINDCYTHEQIRHAIVLYKENTDETFNQNDHEIYYVWDEFVWMIVVYLFALYLKSKIICLFTYH